MVKKGLKKKVLDTYKGCKIVEERKQLKGVVVESGIYIWKGKTRLTDTRFKNIADALAYISAKH